MTEAEITSTSDHFNQFIDFIKKTDMASGQSYINMYNDLMNNLYTFHKGGDEAMNNEQINSDPVK